MPLLYLPWEKSGNPDFRGLFLIPFLSCLTHTDGTLRLLMFASTVMSAACLSGLILGSFMCTLIVLCRKFNCDPGNFPSLFSVYQN